MRFRPLSILTLAFYFAWLSALPTYAQDANEQEEQAMKAAIAAVAPAVVRVESFGGLEKVGQVLLGSGPTTGLVVSADGYVISSAFNFLQQPASILVTLPSGGRAPAEIVSRDHSRMLVLLKLNTKEKLFVPPAVPRNEMTVGQWTIALGRTYDQTEPSVSVGILSAINRVWGKAIQTDAKVSPSNYGGPLIDIRGRVLGVLAPLSPQALEEVAGAEWYDSGIGFAIPLEDILARLDRMKKGEDLRPGLLGVSFKPTEPLSDPAVIAACPVKSPAAVAGLKVGDKIVEADGHQVERIDQLKHALGRHYAGEKVKIVVARSNERITREVELAEKLEPYQHPFVGILPMRGTTEAGVKVRFVYPKSGAEKAGLATGDRIVSLNGKPMENDVALRDAVATFDPGQKLSLGVVREGKEIKLEVTTTSILTKIPESLPPARPTLPASDAERPATGVVPIQIPEDTHKCFAYVPENYRPDVAYGVVVWLHAAGGVEQDKLVARWKSLCENHNLILLAPQSANPANWLATEVPFIRKTLDEVVKRYRIDRSRIVAHGYQAGGAMAYLTAFSHRDLVRGVASVDSPPPLRSTLPDNDPIERLAIYSTYAKDSKVAKILEVVIKRLEEMKYPVTTVTLPEARYLNDQELEELVRWIDTLDRI